MALVRCDKHGKPEGTKHDYSLSVKPVGYPKTAALCGIKGCEEPGLIWLDEYEKPLYEKGQRVFGVHSNAINICAE